MRTIETKLFRYDELSEEAKQAVVQREWDINVHDEWYLHTIDYLKEKYGDEWNVTNIYFSGFASQGDATFEYDGVTKKLYDRFLETLAGRNKIVASYCDWSASGHYHHGDCCEHRIRLYADFDISYYPNCYDVMVDRLDGLWEEFVEEQYRIAAHEMYRALEKEYEFLTSEEQVVETIQCNEYEFLPDGQCPRV